MSYFGEMPNRMLRLAGLVLLAAVALCGCSGLANFDVPETPSAETAPELYTPTPAVDSEYRFAPGDKLRIVSYYDEQLNQSVTVRPDGRISLLLLDDIKVAGMTPEQLDDIVTAGYSRVVKSPEITVVVDQTANREIYLGGEVQVQSSQELTGPRTVTQAVTMAGGFLPTANPEEVLILRKQADGQFKTFKHNVVAVLNNQIPDVYLQRNDIVYVPKSKIADVDLWVEQYINQVIPRAILVTFQYGKLKTNQGSLTVKQ